MRTTISRRGALALAASALVALPAGASAAVDVPGPGAVAKDVRLSDAALERAASHADAGRLTPAIRNLTASRAAMARARSGAAALTRTARTDGQRLRAATAQRIVAAQQAGALALYPSILQDGDARLKVAAAQAALADTTGRDGAVSIIATLIDAGVPATATAGLSRAIAAIQAERDARTAGLREVLESEPLPPAARTRIARAVQRAEHARQKAMSVLEGLLDTVPEAARPAIERAREALASRGAPEIPAPVTPTTGPPSEIPAGPPSVPSPGAGAPDVAQMIPVPVPVQR